MIVAEITASDANVEACMHRTMLDVADCMAPNQKVCSVPFQNT